MRIGRLLPLFYLFVLQAQAAPESPRLGSMDERFRQESFSDPDLSLEAVRGAGLKIFATPFNHADGYGDGPMRPGDTIAPGGRPTLGNNGTFLRVNGLDGQTCLDCHALVSTRTSPPTFGVGGFGGINNAPIFQPTVIDVSDLSESGFAFVDGRLIVPPHLFGVGAVQLLAEEITADLQALADQARSQPGVPVELISKTVHFGHIVAAADGSLDTSAVEGVDSDLVLRPFGRKGEFHTIREFDQEATRFHFGMQPVEMVGWDVDEDGDGVANELLIGEMSALEIFITTQDRPYRETLNSKSVAGFVLFNQIGCTGCHRSALETESPMLDFRLTQEDPPFFSVDLSKGQTRFDANGRGGLVIPLFSDLKRHDMGDGLAESFQAATERQNREFITARLWGVADSAPYLHDGRALTLDEAIRWHGGEAESVRDAYLALSDDGQESLRAFLLTLRLPQRPNADVMPDRE